MTGINAIGKVVVERMTVFTQHTETSTESLTQIFCISGDFDQNHLIGSLQSRRVLNMQDWREAGPFPVGAL